ncbi:MAG: Clp protease N-terminal domain-containing protein, partial [Bryobacteraceae bacterium]
PMFERYTENARRAIFFARHEAAHAGSRFVETPDLLLGILRETPVLPELLDTIAVIRNEISAERPPRASIALSAEIPLGDDCKEALSHSADEAGREGSRAITPKHLLIGILRLPGSLGAKILASHGITEEKLLAQVFEMVFSQRNALLFGPDGELLCPLVRRRNGLRQPDGRPGHGFLSSQMRHMRGRI